jgi:hypothetical protein
MTRNGANFANSLGPSTKSESSAVRFRFVGAGAVAALSGLWPVADISRLVRDAQHLLDMRPEL